jgi:hypothetical protein
MMKPIPSDQSSLLSAREPVVAKRTARLVFPQVIYDELVDHLFCDDGAEHAAILLAGWHQTSSVHRLLVREAILAREPDDHRVGDSGHLALQPSFIRRAIKKCRDERLVYLSVHNHGGKGHVAFSVVDLASHERGYPALLDIAAGMPVGAVVMAEGAVEVDLWLPGGSRIALDRAEVIGETRTLYYSSAQRRREAESPGVSVESSPSHARQELFLGIAGQRVLKGARVAVIGLGGVGSLIVELIARLGVGQLLLIDPDRIEPSNFSRITGAMAGDVASNTFKTDIAARISRQANPDIEVSTVKADVAELSVARRLLESDYIFLAADSMRARLLANAIAQQYFIPVVQMGTKISIDPDGGAVTGANSFVRHVGPGVGCLICNGLIDLVELSEEWKTDRERSEQRYGTQIANPSVITMNAVCAAHAANDFLMFLVGLAHQVNRAPYRRFEHLTGTAKHTYPRRDATCVECAPTSGSRFGMGDARPLPCSDSGRS